MSGAYTIQAVRERLPGLTRADLLPHLGPSKALNEGKDWRHIPEAAAAAIGAPRLAGRRPMVVAARVAAIHVGRDLGAPARWLAAELALSLHGLRFLRRKAPDPALVLAIRRQLWLREHCRPEPPPLLAPQSSSRSMVSG